MRSTGKAVLVAGALASGSLFGIGTYTALAQGFGGMPGSHAMPSMLTSGRVVYFSTHTGVKSWYHDCACTKPFTFGLRARGLRSCTI